MVDLSWLIVLISLRSSVDHWTFCGLLDTVWRCCRLRSDLHIGEFYIFWIGFHQSHLAPQDFLNTVNRLTPSLVLIGLATQIIDHDRDMRTSATLGAACAICLDQITVDATVLGMN